MPIYEFEDSITGERWEKFCSWDERTKFLFDNPTVQPVVSAPKIVSGVGDTVKPDAGFKDLLNKVADQNPYSPLADTHGSKSIKDVKTRAAVEKARNKVGGAVG
jgi:hypothetical protein